jgi:hypothetical protein
MFLKSKFGKVLHGIGDGGRVKAIPRTASAVKNE